MSLPLSRPSLRRQDFDHVLDAMVHDRLASGEVSQLLCREIAHTLRLKETFVFASVTDSIRNIVRTLGLSSGDKVVLSPLAPPYWADSLARSEIQILFADVCVDSPVIDLEQVALLLPQQPKAIVADCCLGFLPDFALLNTMGVPVIADISQGMGGVCEGAPVGSLGDVVLAQFSPETLVAGAGGCLVGYRNLQPDAVPLVPWEALSDLSSALILSQWSDLGVFSEKKRVHFRQLFLKLPRHYRQPKQPGDSLPVLPWFPVLVDSGAKEVLAYSRKKSVEANWAFRNLSHINADSSIEFCPHARTFVFHTLIFPLYTTFSLKELELLGKVISSLP